MLHDFRNTSAALATGLAAQAPLCVSPLRAGKTGLLLIGCPPGETLKTLYPRPGPAQAVRKERAVGVVPAVPTVYEVLEELAITAQHAFFQDSQGFLKDFRVSVRA